MKEKQLGGSHRQMSEPLQQIIEDRKRMLKPNVSYGIETYDMIGFIQKIRYHQCSCLLLWSCIQKTFKVLFKR